MSIFDLFDFVKNLIYSLGYFGIFLGTFLESVFPPIPSEAIMGLAGFLVSEGRFNFLLVIIAAVLGNMASASLIWFLGRKYGNSFVLGFGKYVGITAEEVQKGEDLFNKHGYKIVLLCQMIPLARSWIAFPAGTLKTKYPTFILFNTLGATVWLTVLCYFGYIAGDNWEIIQESLKPYERGIGIAAILILAIFVGIWFWKNIYLPRKNKSLEETKTQTAPKE